MVCFRPHLIDIICRSKPPKEKSWLIINRYMGKKHNSTEDIFLTHYWFISPKYRQNSTLALCTFLLAFVVILLGAYTRLTDAGLSCPDWPHCYGYVTAPHTLAQLQEAAQKYPTAAVNIKKAWTEMTHRYFAGAEGIFILIFSLSILLTRKAKSSKSTLIAL